ncbi:hypothetical protein D3C72_2433130 [compost metagenome]
MLNSNCRVSDNATTACLVTLYGAINGLLSSPASDAVLITCAGWPCLSNSGTKLRMPLIVPCRLMASMRCHCSWLISQL